jgi:hypothetical protein
VATFARCHAILAADARALDRRLAPAFADAAADLGIASGADVRRRPDDVVAFLPGLWRTAEAIVNARRRPAG